MSAACERCACERCERALRSACEYCACSVACELRHSGVKVVVTGMLRAPVHVRVLVCVRGGQRALLIDPENSPTWCAVFVRCAAGERARENPIL